MKDRKPTAAEIINDPSLRWSYYRRGEVVWSDGHQAALRFVRYERGKVRLMSLAGMEKLPGLVGVLSIRRASTMRVA